MLGSFLSEKWRGVEKNPIITETEQEMKAKNRKRVSFMDETEPLINNDDKLLTVKILMTKEEAVRLLSKCKDGGRLEFGDVAGELMQIPVNRRRKGISVVDHKEV